MEGLAGSESGRERTERGCGGKYKWREQEGMGVGTSRRRKRKGSEFYPTLPYPLQ